MWQCPKCGRTFSRKNQHHFCGEAPETIPAYIDRQEEAVRNYLKALYEILNGALPGVKQRIAWGMPAYGEKKILLQFAAFPNHISLYVGEDGIAHFQDALKGYVCKKSAVDLDYTQPLPESLITEIAQWCLQNEAKF